MLKIKKNPTKKPASDVTFATPATLQKQGIEMLIALNLTPNAVITGPEVDLDAKILVTKDKPHFFFNPSISDLNDDEEGCIIIQLSYQDYLGNEHHLEIDDENGNIRKSVGYLHNGRKRATKKTTKG